MGIVFTFFSFRYWDGSIPWVPFLMAMNSPLGRHSQRMSGSPIQKSPDLSLLAAPRSLSQLATSFFSLWHLGIHPALFTIYSYKHSIIDSFNCAWTHFWVRSLKKTFCWMFFHRILFSISLYLFGTSRLSEVIILANIVFKVNYFFKYFFSFFVGRVRRVVRVISVTLRCGTLRCGTATDVACGRLL